MDIITSLGDLLQQVQTAAKSADAGVLAKAISLLTSIITAMSAAQRARVQKKLSKKALEQIESLVTKATLDDVRRYDPAVRQLHQIAGARIGAIAVTGGFRVGGMARKKAVAKRAATGKRAGKKAAVKRVTTKKVR